jgi:hypothetical protein
MKFYDRNWVLIGTKVNLLDILHARTGIRINVLTGSDPPSMCSIAERMSWAAERTTTREEDIAYSLLGTFNVNMPLLYGEGQRAFYRLQEQILALEEDYTLLVWARLQYDRYKFQGHLKAGILAQSAADFGTRLTVPYTYERRSIKTRTQPLMVLHEPQVKYRLHARYSWSEVLSVTRIAQSWTAHGMTDLIKPAVLKERFESPNITSRGLRIRLFFKAMPDGDILIWTFCVHTESDSLILVRLQAKHNLLRSTEGLEYLPKQQITDFEAADFDLPVKWSSNGTNLEVKSGGGSEPQ